MTVMDLDDLVARHGMATAAIAAQIIEDPAGFSQERTTASPAAT
jgi:hypothetical protein